MSANQPVKYRLCVQTRDGPGNTPAFTGYSRPYKRVCDRTGRMAQQNRPRQQLRCPFHEPARLSFRWQIGPAPSMFVQGLIKLVVRAKPCLKFGLQLQRRQRFICETAQNIQTNDVAGSFPDAIQGRFAIDQWHEGVLDIS